MPLDRKAAACVWEWGWGSATPHRVSLSGKAGTHTHTHTHTHTKREREEKGERVSWNSELFHRAHARVRARTASVGLQLALVVSDAGDVFAWAPGRADATP